MCGLLTMKLRAGLRLAAVHRHRSALLISLLAA
jgi:hypothetical protein